MSTTVTPSRPAAQPRPTLARRRRWRGREDGSALFLAMMLLTLMAAALGVAQVWSSAVARRTGRSAAFLRAEAAAEAGQEIMFGRFVKWVTAKGGYTPNIVDAQTAGLPGNPAFPAITAVPTWPADSALRDYTYAFALVPVLPDDTVVTSTTDTRYLPSASSPARTGVAENSVLSPVARYVTKTATPLARTVPSRTLTYRATVTATPTVSTVNASFGPVTVTRYFQFNKVSPFSWLAFQNGRKNGGGGTVYSGPLYAATDINMRGVTFGDSVLYGQNYIDGTANNDGSGNTWTGGGVANQKHQVSVFSMIPDITANLAKDGTGTRVQSLESNLTPDGTGSKPADYFSTRELIEPPSNPANDTTPATVKDKRIFSQADARVKIASTTTKVGGVNVVTVSKKVVDAQGNTVTAPWATALLTAFNVKTTTDPNPFYDRSRSTSAPVQVTDINVGKLKEIERSYPTNFPTGIIYAWDATNLDAGGTRTDSSTLTGMRVWNAGELPDKGFTFGTNDPAYLRGDFNTGTRLVNDTNPEGGATNLAVKPDSSNINTVGRGMSTTTADQRIVAGYEVKPGAVFGDSVTELTNNFKDVNSKSNNMTGSSTTYNLVEGWSTMNENERRSDDTYLDDDSKANPIWIEDWGQCRRTMSGEEMVLWHSRYNRVGGGGGGSGGWAGDISYDSDVSNIPLNWGSLSFNRERYLRK